MASPGHALRSSAPITTRGELLRKALHLSVGALPIAYSLGLSRGVLVWLLGVMTGTALVVEILRRTSPVAGARFERMLGSMLRANERGSTTGATWLLLSCLVSVVILSRNSAVATLWCAAIGDPAATLVGLTAAALLTGSPRPTGKTLMGSLGCFTVSYLGVWLVAGFQPLHAAIIAAAATIGEALPVRIDDNLRVAAAAGAVSRLFS